LIQKESLVKEMRLKLITPSNLIKSSEEHYKTYENTIKKSATHRMVLFYAVECRLKANGLALYKNDKKGYLKLYDNYLTKGHKVDKLFDILEIEMKMPKSKGIGTCPKAKLERDGYVNIEYVHACWRYGVQIENNSDSLIVKWLKNVYHFFKKYGDFK